MATPQKTYFISRMGLTALLVGLIVSPLIGLGWRTQGHAESDTESPADSPEKPTQIGHSSFLSPHASPITVHGEHVFVANTPSDTVDVIAKSTREIFRRIDVGIDPVSIAVRPDDVEIWVANHVSDSVFPSRKMRPRNRSSSILNRYASPSRRRQGVGHTVCHCYQ